jgi:hypothetical protein
VGSELVLRERVSCHQNPSSGSRVVPCRRTDGRTDRQTDITKLRVPFRNFPNAINSLFRVFCNYKHMFKWLNIALCTTGLFSNTLSCVVTVVTGQETVCINHSLKTE